MWDDEITRVLPLETMAEARARNEQELLERSMRPTKDIKAPQIVTQSVGNGDNRNQLTVSALVDMNIGHQ